MKRFLALAALVLGMVSCQTEPEGLDVNVGGEQNVNITVSLPEGTRADSALGAFDNVDLINEYDVRFQCEVHYGDQKKVLPMQISDNGKEATFPVRLIANRNYTFVVWADLVEQGKTTDLHYNTTNGLANITLNDTWVAMDETRDAFTCAEVREFKRNENIRLELKRPFAKLRVITTDMKELMGIQPTSVEVEYTTNHFNSYNALTKTPSGELRQNHVKRAIPAYGYEADDAEKTLFTDYFFATETQKVVNFNMNVYDQNDVIIDGPKSFNTPIPTKRNYVTTIKGNILTYADDFTVVILPDFDGEEIVEYVDTASKLQELINEATNNVETTIVLGGNINLDDILSAGTLATRAAKDYALLIPADKKIVLDLNGYTISQTKECTGNYAMIVNKGELTIAGEGKISLNDTGAGDPSFGWGTYTLRNEGKLVVNGSTIEHLGAQEAHMRCAIFQYSGSSVINGGVISTPYYRSARLWSGDMTINGGSFKGQLWLQAVDDTSDLTINGGTFAPRGNDGSSVFVTNSGKSVKFAVNGGHFTTKIGMSEPFGCITGGTFTTEAKEATNEAIINEDYTWVEAENGLWTLGLKPAVAKIGEVEYKSLQKAFDAVEEDANTIVLVDDVNVNAAVVLAEGKTATLDLNGKTLTATNYAIENNGTLTITGDGTINGVVYGENGTTTVENGTFNPADGGAYVFLNSTAGTLIINGGTINTGSSYPVYSYNEKNKLIINNVTINGKFGCVNAYGTNGSVEINGGTFQMTGVQGNTSHITYFSSNIVATINGGTFEKIGDISMSATGGGGICVNGGANLTINGGTFAGDHDDVYNYGGTISVKGGEYKFEPDFVAEGYVVDEIDGRYQVVKDVKVAKVGTTEYRKIEDAIAAWTHNSTLTLMSDVTLTDVITIKSTEYRVLDLGTFTMTAAKGKDAISITAEGRSSASYALDIKADATNPGGITATSKAVVKTTGKSGVKDRPIIRFYNGVYSASNVISHSGSNGTNCPQFQFHNGVYNANISANRALIQIYGGTFNGRFFASVDSSAYMLISGGKFKYLDNLYGSALNADKFTIGSTKGAFDRGVYVDDEGYIVVGGAVITEFGDKFAAKATNASKAGSYLQYSSAAANGLYYTNADAAIAKHGEANVELK